MAEPADLRARQFAPGNLERLRLLRMTDLCGRRSLGLSKALLSSLAFPKSALDLYAEYFRPFCIVDDDNNLSALQRRGGLERKVRDSMFEKDLPLKDPAFFSFSSHHDVNRLAALLGLEIVIYFTNSLAKFTWLDIFHDFRSLGSTLRPRKTVYFVVTTDKELAKLEFSLDHLFEGLSCTFSLSEFRTTFSDDFNSGFGSDEILKAASFLLSLPDPDIKLPGGAEALLEASTEIKPPSRISNLGVQLYSLWKEKILFVSYCRLLVPKGSLTKLRKPKSRYFSTLLIVGPACKSMKELRLEEATKVVCIFGGGNVCLLNPDHSSAVVAACLETNERDRPTAGNFLKISKVSRAETAAESEKKKAEKKPTRADLKEKICKCDTCTSKSFNDNMSKAGPERLCVTPYSIRELLQLLGQDTKTNLDIVERMCELSVASMDIESRTLPVHLNPPQFSSHLPYSQIDTAHLGAHYKKVQKPLMISHVDGLTFLLPASKRLTLTVASDDEESCYEMMKKYWNEVLRLQNACRLEKLKISAPLLKLVNKYKKAYFDECSKWLSSLSPFDPETGVFCSVRAKEVLELQDTHTLAAQTRAWWQLLPGQLESQLTRLQRDYHVFSFYG